MSQKTAKQLQIINKISVYSIYVK